MTKQKMTGDAETAREPDDDPYTPVPAADEAVSEDVAASRTDVAPAAPGLVLVYLNGRVLRGRPGDLRWLTPAQAEDYAGYVTVVHRSVT